MKRNINLSVNVFAIVALLASHYALAASATTGTAPFAARVLQDDDSSLRSLRVGVCVRATDYRAPTDVQRADYAGNVQQVMRYQAENATLEQYFKGQARNRDAVRAVASIPVLFLAFACASFFLIFVYASWWACECLWCACRRYIRRCARRTKPHTNEQVWDPVLVASTLLLGVIGLSVAALVLASKAAASFESVRCAALTPLSEMLYGTDTGDAWKGLDAFQAQFANFQTLADAFLPATQQVFAPYATVSADTDAAADALRTFMTATNIPGTRTDFAYAADIDGSAGPVTSPFFGTALASFAATVQIVTSTSLPGIEAATDAVRTQALNVARDSESLERVRTGVSNAKRTVKEFKSTLRNLDAMTTPRPARTA